MAGLAARDSRRNAADLIRRYRGTAKRNIAREVALRRASDGSSVNGAPEPAASDGTPSQQFLQQDAEMRVTEALGRLSDDHHEVIQLRNLQRLPFNEVAQRMGRTRAAVQMLWMRAIKKLQEALGVETGCD